MATEAITSGWWDDEASLIATIARTNIALSLPIFVALYFFIPSPYGKLAQSSKWWLQPAFPAPLSWFVFESPNLIWALVCWVATPSPAAWPNRILFSFFTLHYIQRGLYYPIRMSRVSSKPVPLIVIVCALLFCTGNGYIQCRFLLQFQQFPEDWIWNGQFWFGLILASTGAALNVHSDTILRALKNDPLKNDPKRGSSTYYRIPYGGGFAYCSSPHYLGEMVEWIGFAMACQGSLVAVSFAIYTAANLVPRGVAQHQWYKSHFGKDYPSNRTAVIPWIL